MKSTKSCPKCGSTDIVRIPDNLNHHASGNNIRYLGKSLYYVMLVVHVDMQKIGLKTKKN